uniref:HDC08279 n=1 Tax=Drosophila melanogaster TaxID=7227 RepID=Q6ILV3_DROME|nr:TPA_inf: HDC08279 [Drosophila melanogaster]
MECAKAFIPRRLFAHQSEFKSVARNRFMLLSAAFELEFGWQSPRHRKRTFSERSEGNAELDSQTIRQARRLNKKDLPGGRTWRHNNWQKVQIPDIEKAQNTHILLLLLLNVCKYPVKCLKYLWKSVSCSTSTKPLTHKNFIQFLSIEHATFGV